ncbi:hypothetical protein MAM1_0004d00496 [Mucor ambiguus]|uniref:Uncharacterized protein n=1 Tax=Mucor ambiguus TaxID=91626 RepID=A0A0C9LPV4_9FUNG|nr:hypothetical protein MAM1_0004d00496 [Mucor ambiguus]
MLSLNAAVVEEVHSQMAQGNVTSLWSAIREKIGHETQKKSVESNDQGTMQIKSDQEEQYILEKVPSQMAPIDKPLVYLHPKVNERWVIKEEGFIVWAVSDTLQSKADNIYMNCNLYQGNNMLLSVFKGVPLVVGTESWTPPVFLEAAPDYRFRLWSQPSEMGIIDEYSVEFSMVPRPDDAYMFSYNKSLVMDISNSTLPPDTRIRIGQYNLPSVNETEHSDIMLSASETPTASFSDPNIPTGIYALYPSGSWQLSFELRLLAMVAITVSVVAFV